MERSAIEVLRSEQMLFLVTQRNTSLVLVELTESNPILGRREGILLATVRFYFGVDLEALTEDSLERRGDSLTVHMPDPGILDISPDLGTLRFWSKRSGLLALSDMVTGYDQDLDLLGMLDSCAREYASLQDMIPERGAMLDRLNGMAPLFADYIGVESVRFE